MNQSFETPMNSFYTKKKKKFMKKNHVFKKARGKGM